MLEPQHRRLAKTCAALNAHEAAGATAGDCLVDWRLRRPSPPRLGVPTAVLTDAQVQRFSRDGFLLASGLLPDKVADRAERTMWDLCGLDPAASPDTWLQFGEPAPHLAAEGQRRADDGDARINVEEGRGNLVTNGLQNPDLMACATDRYLGAMAQLLGVDPSELHPPQSVHTQNLLPRPGGPRSEVRPHVDGIPKQHNHSTFPGPFNITSLRLVRPVLRAARQSCYPPQP
eukprot:COSAG05_NODE_5845_length_1074_cov_1.619487_1_plen_231_part_00